MQARDTVHLKEQNSKFPCSDYCRTSEPQAFGVFGASSRKCPAFHRRSLHSTAALLSRHPIGLVEIPSPYHTRGGRPYIVTTTTPRSNQSSPLNFVAVDDGDSSRRVVHGHAQRCGLHDHILLQYIWYDDVMDGIECERTSRSKNNYTYVPADDEPQQ